MDDNDDDDEDFAAGGDPESDDDYVPAKKTGSAPKKAAATTTASKAKVILCVRACMRVWIGGARMYLIVACICSLLQNQSSQHREAAARIEGTVRMTRRYVESIRIGALHLELTDGCSVACSCRKEGAGKETTCAQNEKSRGVNLSLPSWILLPLLFPYQSCLCLAVLFYTCVIPTILATGKEGQSGWQYCGQSLETGESASQILRVGRRGRGGSGSGGWSSCRR